MMVGINVCAKSGVPEEKAFLANAYSMLGQCQGMVGKMKARNHP